MLTRRQFMELGVKSGVGVAFLPAAACAPLRSRPSSDLRARDLWVNDIHSRLNRTHVHSIVRPDSVEALQAIRQSDEFNDLLKSLRSHAAHTLRELATLLDQAGAEGGPGVSTMTTQDLVDRVRSLVGRE